MNKNPRKNIIMHVSNFVLLISRLSLTQTNTNTCNQTSHTHAQHTKTFHTNTKHTHTHHTTKTKHKNTVVVVNIAHIHMFKNGRIIYFVCHKISMNLYEFEISLGKNLDNFINHVYCKSSEFI